MICIGSFGGVSFGGVRREGAPVMLIAGTVAPGAVPGKLPKADPDPGARGILGAGLETAGSFVPKREPVMNLESGADGASALGSDFGMRLNAPSLVPANRLGGVTTGTGFVASSSGVDFASGFVGATPNAGTVEGFSLRGATATPFVARSGGVFGLPTADKVGGDLTDGSTKGSTLIGGGGVCDLASAAGDGEGDGLEVEVEVEGPASHCPNGAFGSAGRGLSEGDFSPLTSSSSPPDTGVFARGELRSGRVLGLPRPTLEPGDGVSEGDGSVGVGCWSGVCNDSPPFDGDPGGVVLFARVVDDS